jgi:metal-sulfur cluster biosynthetic enzyme
MTDERQAVIWQSESTHPDLAEKAKEALREVIDPEIGLNLIELGLIRDVTISDEEAHIIMILTTPFCPYGPALLEMARKKVEDSLSLTTTIEVGMEMWDPTMMEEGAGADWGLF